MFSIQWTTYHIFICLCEYVKNIFKELLSFINILLNLPFSIIIVISMGLGCQSGVHRASRNTSGDGSRSYEWNHISIWKNYSLAWKLNLQLHPCNLSTRSGDGTGVAQCHRACRYEWWNWLWSSWI